MNDRINTPLTNAGAKMIKTAMIMTTVVVAAACTKETPAIVESLDSRPMHLTGQWHVESIDEAGIVDSSNVTVTFGPDSAVYGSTGCNRYNGKAETTNHQFVIANAASTRRSCVPALNQQEQRFLDALNDAVRYEMKDKQSLIIYDAQDKPRLKLFEIGDQAESASSEP